MRWHLPPFHPRDSIRPVPITTFILEVDRISKYGASVRERFQPEHVESRCNRGHASILRENLHKFVVAVQIVANTLNLRVRR